MANMTMAKKANNLTSFGIIPMAAVLGGFIIALALSILVVQPAANSGHRTQLGQTLASELAQQINNRESLIRTQLEKMATSPIVINAINGNNADLIEAEANLTAIIPYVARVRLIPMGQAKTDQGFPPFNYTALDLVNSAETGRAPPPEAISSQAQLEGEKWIIVATSIKTLDGTNSGTLFVYLNSLALSDGVSDGSKGEVRVMQNVGTTPKPVINAGSGGGVTVFDHPLNNMNWTLQYAPSESLIVSTPLSLLFYLIAPIVMLLIAAGGVFYGINKINVQIQYNLTLLGNQIVKAATDSYDDETKYTIAGFEGEDYKLKKLQEMKPGTRTTKTKGTEPKTQNTDAPSTKKAAAAEVVEIEMSDDGEPFTEVEDIEVDDFGNVIIDDYTVPDEAAESIAHIFRAYDIRGIVGESLSEEIARKIGLAIGSEATDRGEDSILVGYDGREYSPALAEALIEGITASGQDVVNLGAVPTPVLYYATHNSNTQSGVMVTGSHNPPEYNGFKVVLAGKTLVGKEIRALYDRIESNNFTSGEGSVNEFDISPDYMDAIADDVVVAQPLKVVIDCGNGIAGAIAPELLDSLGCEAIPLYCDVDGSFPNHHPDPTKPANLEDLIGTVKSQGADLGIALDGDGDRIVAVTAEGEIVWPDRLLMLFAKDVVSRNPGSDVVYDVKCTRHLNSVISGFGGRPIICRSGHSYIKEKIAETGAMLGGEMSGHICFSERWFGFDDGLYSAARLLEIVGSQEEGLSDLLKEFPVSVNTPEIHIAVEEGSQFTLVEAIIEAADFEDASFTTIDGLRVDFPDGWGLVRASNTEPALTLRFEADSLESLDDIKAAFRELLQEVREDLNFE
ncbi:MAG: phosphomannomutase/phosphoglucomutase [Candidatus Azotimanducaceae bacterium]|jgi:phosphomannomutase/phosphoglucomutase